MKILSRYIFSTVAQSVTIVVCVLLFAEMFIEFTHEFKSIGTGSYTLLQALLYVPMILPTDIYQIFPMAGLLGSIIGLGMLASQSELVVMRASGVSIRQIIFALLKIALVLALIMMIVGEFIAPILQHKAEMIKTSAISNGKIFLSKQGLWLKSDNNFIHVNKIMPNGNLEGITRYNFNDENKLVFISFAKSARQDKNSNRSWQFQNINQTNLLADGTTSVDFIANQTWDMQLNPSMLALTSGNTDQQSLIELYKYTKYLKLSGLNAQNNEFVFWQRILQPLATLIMIILAVPFIFGPLRSSSAGFRMLLGALAGFAFYMINQFVAPLGMIYQFSPIFSALVPIVIFAGVGAVILFKQ